MLKVLLRVFLFILPLHTILITRESFLNGTKWEYGTLGFFATEVLLWVTVFVFIVWVFKHKNFKFQISHFRLSKDRVFLFFVLLFVLWGYASVLWSHDKDLALQQVLHLMEAALLFVMLIAGPLKFRRVGAWFIFGACVVGLLGVGQFVFQDTFSSTLLGVSKHVPYEAGTSVVSSSEIGRWLRAYGSFSHPNIFGGYMAIAFFISVMLFGVRFCRKKKCWIYQYIIPTVLLMGVFMSFSRSAIVVTAVALCVVFLYSLSRKKGVFSSYVFVYSLSLFVLLVTVFAPLVYTRLAVSSPQEKTSLSERSSQVHESWELSKKNIWTGVGAGNYTRALYEIYPDRPGWEYQPVHNVFLLIFVELGMIGLILLFCISVSFLIFVDSFICKGKKRHCWLMKNAGIWFVLVSIFFPYMFISFFDHYLFSSYIGLMLLVAGAGLTTRCLIDHFHKPSTVCPQEDKISLK